MTYENRPNRRDVLKATGVAVGSAALPVGSAAADSTWRYDLAAEALDVSTEEMVIRDNRWAFTANGDAAMAVADLADPEAPVLRATALGHGTANSDVSVSGDLAGLANDGVAEEDDPEHVTNPAGVTFFDVSDPTDPVELSFYDDVESGIHNHFVDGDYAYLCENDSGDAFFSRSRISVLDVSDPTDPVEVGEWRLKNHHLDMAMAGVNPAHDVVVQDGLAYVAWWDAGTVVLDVSDPTDPVEVAHFGATDDADEPWDSYDEYLQRYLGQPGNAHYARPTPDGSLTLVGAETIPGPYQDTVIPGTHGGIKIFDTSDLSALPDDPTALDPVGFIPAPEEPKAGTMRTSHNFDVTDSKVHTSWYQGGVRLFDIEDPADPTELAAWVSPDGQEYWGADHLSDGGTHYSVGNESDGKGLTVLEIVHETGSTDGADDWPDLGPEDVLELTMQEPL